MLQTALSLVKLTAGVTWQMDASVLFLNSLPTSLNPQTNAHSLFVVAFSIFLPLLLSILLFSYKSIFLLSIRGPSEVLAVFSVHSLLSFKRKVNS